MANEEHPYKRRVFGAKDRAQRLEVNYQRRPRRLRGLRVLIAVAPLAAAACAIPFFFGSGKKALANGPVSRSHAVFEKNCALCHGQVFSKVSDQNCKSCHDGAAHTAKVNATEEERCRDCHVEHRGRFRLADVDDNHCARCHNDLPKHGGTERVAASVTAFGAGDRPGDHPNFLGLAKPDERPIKLNHALHMKQWTVGRREFPGMECRDCHMPDPDSSTGEMLPVTFERNCRVCHADQLQFDNPAPGDPALATAESAPLPLDREAFSEKAARWFSAIPASPAPMVPHNKDAAKMKAIIQSAYEARDRNPARVNAEVRNALNFLSGNCQRCHVLVASGGLEVFRVNVIRERYSFSRPAGERWLSAYTKFSHRVHRPVRCADCHVTALTSTETRQVLLPDMKVCMSCHNTASSAQGRCSECHTYHQKGKDRENGRPLQQLTGGG